MRKLLKEIFKKRLIDAINELTSLSQTLKTWQRNLGKERIQTGLEKFKAAFES